ncbi:MAG: HEPN domain-containing protein [Defluviitaleaceae bacterium]|nr:HEPN domain-containing protein [Defluviitaleaceae bacterium]MCL2263738.1 HEPN domain-containing protein [Defluviitaleaceae bacterium]
MSDKVDYWLELCDEDLITAKILLQSKRLLHMGFYCHMIVEKALKAVVASKTSAIPPKIHDLEKLAVRGGIAEELSEKQRNLMDDLSPLHIETRYPEYKAKMAATLTFQKCKRLLAETEEFLCWIKELLGRLPKDTQAK